MAIKYKNMDAGQKKRVEVVAKHWGVPVEAVTMNDHGKIIVSMKKMLKYMSRLDYNIIIKDHVSRSEIDDEYRKAYIEQWERDRPGDKDLEEAKAGLAALRG